MPDWKDACQNRVLTADITNRFQILPVAKTLSRVVSDSNRRMIYKFAMDRGVLWTRANRWGALASLMAAFAG
jgi:hypothetical protein